MYMYLSVHDEQVGLLEILCIEMLQEGQRIAVSRWVCMVISHFVSEGRIGVKTKHNKTRNI
jgi:hypothetical protein